MVCRFALMRAHTIRSYGKPTLPSLTTRSKIMTEHLISRPAHPAECARCGSRVLTGMDGGLTVAANPQPLTVAAEIAARIDGRPVFDLLITAGGKTYLTDRHVNRVRAGRDNDVPVLGAHECGARAVAAETLDYQSRNARRNP